MGIEGKCSSISFLYSMVVFSLNLLLKFYWSLFLSLLFVAQKVSKSSASEYNTSLLADCKRAQPTLFKKAQHRQNQFLAPRLTNFRWAKISLVRRSLVGNFPLTVAGCASLATLTARQKTYTSFPRLLLRPLPVILTVLYLREVTFVKRALPLM